MNLKIIVPTVALLAVASLGTWYLMSADSDNGSAKKDSQLIAVPEILETPDEFQQIKRIPEVSDDEPAEEAPKKEPKEELPPLDALPKSLPESDAGLIESTKNLAPKLIAWMTPDQQIRKWVFMVDNIAEGSFPVQNRPLSYDVDKFQADETDNTEVFYLSERNFKRAEQLINTITQIPAEELVRYYQHWLPLLNDAYDELGREDNFEERLQQAIENILAIEPLNDKIQLKHPSVFYVYSDKNLEKADKLHKLFWRLGPKNTAKVQAYLKTVEPLVNPL